MEYYPELSEFFWQVMKQINAFEKEKLSCCNLTTPQSHTLREIGLRGTVNMIDLAEALSLKKSTISRTVDILVDMGAVCREIDPANRRYVILSLTLSGKQIYDLMSHIFDEYCASLMKDIPIESQQQVLWAIQALGAGIKKNQFI